MCRTFKAKIHGSFLRSEGEQKPVDITVTFNKYRVLLEDNQIGRITLDPPWDKFIVADKMEYRFDKKPNKEDKKMFSVYLFDNLYHLQISFWGKIRANIIHHRYWVDREKDWFLKTLIAAAIGFIFGLIGSIAGYQKGFQDGIKEGKAQSQDITLKR